MKNTGLWDFEEEKEDGQCGYSDGDIGKLSYLRRGRGRGRREKEFSFSFHDIFLLNPRDKELQF